MKDKKFLDEFIDKCINQYHGRFCIDEVTTGMVTDVIVMLPSCYFVMNTEQYSYFFKRVFNAF